MRYNGHAPGHVRDTFLNAIEAFMSWNPGEPEPTVDFEIGHVPQPIAISKACRLLWHCNDILPGGDFNWLRDDAGLEIGRQTYAAAARAMHAAIKAA